MTQLILLFPTLPDTLPVISRSLVHSPHDFIRKIWVEGDRQNYLETLSGELKESLDFRYLYLSEKGARLAIFGEKLAWDTKFFGFSIVRINEVLALKDSPEPDDQDYANALRHFQKAARERGVKYIFLSVHARNLALFRNLGQAGFDLIETRLYYHMNLLEHHFERRFAVRAATEEDLPSLQKAARDMINPFDRFHADPFLSPPLVDRLMEKWVEASILENFADITIVPDVSAPSAFCTVRYHKNKWDGWKLRLSQPVFSAVSTEFKGWYVKIISEINYHLREIGAEHSYLITQATNNEVICVWEKLGYHYGKAEHIFRAII